MSAETTRITQIIFDSMIEEVETTPKPGLVDLLGNGAHKDLNPELFRKSAQALKPTFLAIAELGASWNQPLAELFKPIRQIGLEGEKAMYKATNNVNTHKGALFSLGILAAVTGYAIKNNIPLMPENLCMLASEMTRADILEDFKQMDKKSPQTHGEKLYHIFGHKGIRGEVMEAFPNLRNHVFPYLDQQQTTLSLQNKLHVLLLLMANLEDTNVLSRGGEEGLCYVHEKSRELLEEEKRQPSMDLTGKLIELDAEFIKRNLSPGGAADLLSVTYFFSKIRRLSNQS